MIQLRDITAPLGLALAIAQFALAPAKVETRGEQQPDNQRIVQGRVDSVQDGDTFMLESGGQRIKIRVRFADCPEFQVDDRGHAVPEKTQPHGREARDFTRKFLAGRTVTAKLHGKSYDRELADVYVGQKSLAEELTSRGLAMVDERFTKSRTMLGLQALARDEHKGVWSEPHPTPPWEFRKRHKQPAGE